MQSPQPEERELTLRYATSCRACGAALSAKTRVVWNRQTKTARCLTCAVPAQPAPPAAEVVTPLPATDFGIAGASAQRVFDKQEARRRERLRRNWWVLAIIAVVGAVVGGFIAHRIGFNVGLGAVIGAGLPLLDLLKRPQHIDAWRSGAAGERAVGDMLDRMRAEGVVAVHDRRVPGRRTNIDHIAVSPAGVFVVDTKNVAGKVAASRRGLTVAGRRQDKMLDGVVGQVAVVQGVLAQAGFASVAVRGVLCFTKADLPWLRPQPRGIALLYRRGLRRELTKGPAIMSRDQVNVIAAALATHLSPA
jgi:hypothetical protein